MRVGDRMLDALLSVGLPDHEAAVVCPAIRWHAEVLQRFIYAVVRDPDFHDRARFLRGRNPGAESLAEFYGRLDLVHRRHPLALAVPEIILIPDPHVLAHDDRHRLSDGVDAHPRPERDD